MRLRRGARKAAPESVPASRQYPETEPAPAPQVSDSLVYELLANVALRDLTVIERVLSTISDVERGEQDPERLALYYALDHDITRLRRSAENALVLAGSQAPMGRSEPMTLLDVARAAASESADYTRVSVESVPQISVGPAVADDLAHTLAELMDNALAVSPSRAKVTVTGAKASGGVLIAVEDEGIGIPPERLPELNLRLTGPLVLDAPTTRQMGLYVVAHLARRHGIYVQLQSRRQLGSTAVAFLPERLLLSTPQAPMPGAAVPAPRPEIRQPIQQPYAQPPVSAPNGWLAGPDGQYGQGAYFDPTQTPDAEITARQPMPPGYGTSHAAAIPNPYLRGQADPYTQAQPPQPYPPQAQSPQHRAPQGPRFPDQSRHSRPPLTPAASSAPPPVAPATVDRWAPTAAERAQPTDYTDQGLPRRTRPAGSRKLPGPPPREAKPADPSAVLADLDAFTVGTLDALDAYNPQAVPPARPTPPPLLTDPAQEDY